MKLYQEEPKTNWKMYVLAAILVMLIVIAFKGVAHAEDQQMCVRVTDAGGEVQWFSGSIEDAGSLYLGLLIVEANLGLENETNDIHQFIRTCDFTYQLVDGLPVKKSYSPPIGTYIVGVNLNGGYTELEAPLVKLVNGVYWLELQISQ